MLSAARPLLGDNRAMLRLPSCRLPAWVLALAGALAAPAAHAQDPKPVYRCPGPPVLYTDAISAQEARDKGCRTIEGAPVTVVQTTTRPKPATSTVASGGPASGNGTGGAPVSTHANPNANPSASANPGSRVDPGVQRARDTDARRILGEELRAEEERLVSLQRDYNNGEPERRGDERNFQRYAERVAEMKAGILRKEADIAALRRELAKLPP